MTDNTIDWGDFPEEELTFVDHLLDDSDAEMVKMNIETGNLNTGHRLKIVIEGPSKNAYWHDDLKAATAISLIEMIDIKNFDGDYEAYNEVVEALETTIKQLREF